MQCKLLAGVPDKVVRQVLSIARRRTFKRGEVVFHEADPADSLHLVELTVELEDTYGVKIPDDDAVRLLTVGQAADYVAAHAPEPAS